jgi:hypothetical protein
MNLSQLRKLPKEKRQHLVIVAVVTLLVLAALGPFRLKSLGVGGLTSYQRHNLELLGTKQENARIELRRIQDAVKLTAQIEAEAAEARKALADAESDIASGDVYSWVFNTLRKFQAGYKVNIPQFLPVGATTDVNLMPNFPYKQATLSVSGTAHFHDLGLFLAGLENQFPHIRVLNLSVELNLNPAAEEKETVSFKMDIVTLVKPNAT